MSRCEHNLTNKKSVMMLSVGYFCGTGDGMRT